jgi:hypothetical protein
MLCIKLEINQGYTTMHGQPIIKKYLYMFIILANLFYYWHLYNIILKLLYPYCRE